MRKMRAGPGAPGSHRKKLAGTLMCRCGPTENRQHPIFFAYFVSFAVENRWKTSGAGHLAFGIEDLAPSIQHLEYGILKLDRIAFGTWRNKLVEY